MLFSYLRKHKTTEKIISARLLTPVRNVVPHYNVSTVCNVDYKNSMLKACNEVGTLINLQCNDSS